MGLISNLIFYKVGRRVGRRRASRPRRAAQQEAGRKNPECLNYESFCRNYGNCLDLECEYEL